ncbi:WD40 repeat-like protein [Pluteus cervinus]|uniref:WD40 repeat-like protein n=1 Tax=Pluteus cervinus TaxID=181527 RepID=A0ACD3B4C5_9AGAR|nr:WD40 repeat-like protein [Pluteus cervinus]
MMLAVTASDSLTFVDASSLKKPPPSIHSDVTLQDRPTASAWSHDNATLYLSGSNHIYKFDVSSGSLAVVYTAKEHQEISCVAARHGGVVFSEDNHVHVLECGPTPKIAQTLAPHNTAVSCVSLSEDGTLIASASTGVVHVYSLQVGTYTALRGLGSSQRVDVCAFHPHTRTRLLVGLGKQVLVYDTTRPSSPLKTIPISEPAFGDIVGIACSPFSKTLMAVASLNGYVALIDLEKEKGLFRVVNLRFPLTSISFSPEGASIYLGTEDGRLLILDLRALDRTPKIILMSQTGQRIESLSVQGKAKTRTDTTSKATTVKSPMRSESTRTLAQVSSRASLKTVSSPVRRVIRPDATPTSRRTSSVRESIPGSPLTKSRALTAALVAKKTALAPARDPHGNAGGKPSSLCNDSAKGKSNVTTPLRPSGVRVSRVSPASTSRTGPISPNSPINIRPRQPLSPMAAALVGKRVPIVNRPSTSSLTNKARVVSGSHLPPSDENFLAVPVPASSRTRSRAGSSSSRAESISSARTTSRTGATSVASTIESMPDARRASGSSSAGTRKASSSSSSSSSPKSRMSLKSRSTVTPSPDLPELDEEPKPIMPLSLDGVEKKKGMPMLGLSADEVADWINSRPSSGEGDIKGKGKAVAFQPGCDDSSDTEDEGGTENTERQRNMAIQKSPLRPGLQGSKGWVPSPLRNAASSLPGNNLSSSGSAAHDFLRTIVRDVMFEFQQETKAEMMGLHLDVVRMGRGWKKELRGLMDEYVGDLKDLRDENRTLREENERLRRGY